MAGMGPAHPAHRLGMAPSLLYPLGGRQSAAAAYGRDELTLASNARSAKRPASSPHAAVAMRWACASWRATAATIALVDCVPNSTPVGASVLTPRTVRRGIFGAGERSPARCRPKDC
jgi:hypothetical protein